MFPLSFYLSLITCYFIATFLVLSGIKKTGTIILCLNNIEILIIPYMLGYYSMGRADDMAYIGEYLHIVTSGHIGSWDIYPASHIIGASISMISDLEAHSVSFIIPIVFSFVFIAGVYLFSRELFSNSCVNSLVIVSSFVLYLGIYSFLNVPHGLFFASMPLYLCFFYRHIKGYNNTSFATVFVIFTLLIPITHPFIVFLLLMVFLYYETPKLLSASNMEVLQIPKVKISSFLLFAVSFVGWFIFNNNLMKRFRIIYSSYVNDVSVPVASKTTSKLAEINFSFFDYIQLFSLYVGRYVIPTIIIFVSGIYLYSHKDLLKTKVLKNYPFLFISFILLLFTQLVLLLNPVICHQPDRIVSLNFAVYAQIPLFACALYLFFLRKSKSFNNKLPVCGILLLVWSLSMFGCFDSPNVYRPNVALTYNEVYGMKWFYEFNDTSNVFTLPSNKINRFNDILGNNQTLDNLMYIPDHLGYVNSSGDFRNNLNLDKSAYVIIMTADELLYQEVPGYKMVGRYIKEDFDRFRNDSSVSKVYDSLNIEIFRS